MSHMLSLFVVDVDLSIRRNTKNEMNFSFGFCSCFDYVKNVRSKRESKKSTATYIKQEFQTHSSE